MTYRSLTHVAIRVRGLREAERYYVRLFGLEVAFREAETTDGWRTLPEDAGWEDAEAAGISLSMCVLSRDAFRLALEEDRMVDAHGVLDHVGLLVEPEDLEALRARAEELEAMIDRKGETLLIVDDRYGVRWEITTTVRQDSRSESSGARRGLWLDLGSATAGPLTRQTLVGDDSHDCEVGRVVSVEPIFVVSDVTRAVAHYEQLGFSTSHHDEGYAFAHRNELTIHLAGPGVDPGRVGRGSIYMHVDDADALAEEWRGAGVDFVEPQDFEYGKREGSHEDPDGNLIRFGSPLRR